jgi:hypothetical protein
VVELQAPYRACKEIRNTLQTSALSIDDSGLDIELARSHWALLAGSTLSA